MKIKEVHDGINFHRLAAVIHHSISTNLSECRRASHEGNATRARRCFLLVTTFLCTHKEHFVFVRLCIGTPFSIFTNFPRLAVNVTHNTASSIQCVS